MDSRKIGDGPGRPRTASVRLVLRVAGVGWEDGDQEDGARYAMQEFPWRQWEAYVAAVTRRSPVVIAAESGIMSRNI